MAFSKQQIFSSIVCTVRQYMRFLHQGMFDILVLVNYSTLVKIEFPTAPAGTAGEYCDGHTMKQQPVVPASTYTGSSPTHPFKSPIV